MAETLSVRASIPVGFEPLPLDEAASRLSCMGAVEAEWSTDPLGRLEERAVASRFTGVACIEYNGGAELTLVIGDGVVLGAHLLKAGGEESWGMRALDEAEGLGPGRITLLPLRLSDL